MEAIAAAPAVISVAVCLLASPTRAFLDVFLPVLLLIPLGLVWALPGLPDLGFAHAAIVPIVAMLALAPSTRWTWSATDGLVLSFALATIGSEAINAGASEAQNVTVEMLCLVLMPYAVTKTLIVQPGFAERLTKRIVVLLVVVIVLSAWQFRMGQDPFFRDIWLQFFPEYRAARSQYRWGYARITGPYGHSITAGIILGVGLLLQAWLHITHRWRSRLVSWVLSCGLMTGNLMTMSRGPWLGLLFGAGLAAFGFVRWRRRLLGWIVATAVVLGPPTYLGVSSYVSVGRSEAESQLQENAAYRAELFETYEPIVLQRPLLGWGKRLWPGDEQFRSVDNAYLLLALEHGLLGLSLFVLVATWVAIRLARQGAQTPPRSARGQVAFLLLGTLGSMMLAITTVWLGNQTQPLLFLLVGCGEGFLLGARRKAPAAEPSAHSPVSRSHGFQRVIT